MHDPVVEEYSKAAKDYDQKWSFYVDSTTRETMRRLHLQGTERILDVGCGTGRLAMTFAERVAPTGTVAGVDAAAEMIERAPHHFTMAVG